jgi:peptidoglycan/LPS O-acetylase OafA/YrhL
MAVPLALLVGALAAADTSGRPTRWSSIGLLWLSEVSFAFYLVHHLALRFVIHLAGTARSAGIEALLAAGALALALVASWLLYRLVEVPGRRLLAPRRAGPRRAVAR